jgi:hypothetical protein
MEFTMFATEEEIAEAANNEYLMQDRNVRASIVAVMRDMLRKS